jgi:DNA-directed RNA polymerase specialized sigma24 family protein
VSALQELRHLSYAFDQLPAKCRAVVWMRKVQGLSQRDVAQRLNIAETTVEKHVARGVRFLAGFLFTENPLTENQARTTASAPELKEFGLDEHEQ